MPSVILVILSWCSFWIAPDAIPARISLSITTILSTLLLSGSVNSQMPKVSYLKAIDVFLLGNFAFIFISLMEYVVVLNTAPECPFKGGFLERICRDEDVREQNDDASLVSLQPCKHTNQLTNHYVILFYVCNEASKSFELNHIFAHKHSCSLRYSFSHA